MVVAVDVVVACPPVILKRRTCGFGLVVVVVVMVVGVLETTAVSCSHQRQVDADLLAHLNMFGL